MVGQFQFNVALTSPIAPVLDIPSESLLVDIEIERGNAFSGFE